MTWPLVTRELKSTKISRMMPETWLPTWTFLTGERAPLAATDWTMSPILMMSVFTVIGAALDFAWRQYQKPAAPPTTSRRRIQFNQLMRFLRTAMRYRSEEHTSELQ